ncbi:Hint domain-containing protein, partial [Asaia krungthepensis]
NGGYMAVQGAGAVSRDAVITGDGWQDIGYNNRTGAAGGGVASGTILRNAKQFISSGGSAADTVISAGGTEVISTGGRANNTVINSGGSVSVLGGGYAQNATVSSGGTLTGASGATLDGGTISGGGTATLDPNTLITSQPTVYGTLNGGLVSGNLAVALIKSGGVANNVSATASGAVSVSNGGLTSGTTILSGGTIVVYSGGTSINTQVRTGGVGQVSPGGTETIVNGTGSGMTAFGSGIGDGSGDNRGVGAILIGSGGTGIGETVSGGYLAVQGTGAVSRDAVITANGWQDIGNNNRTGAAGGGVASGTILRNAKQFVWSGGSAANTVISAGGTETVFGGGTSLTPVVSLGGQVGVNSGGTLQGGSVLSGGSVTINQGGKLTGALDLSAGANAMLDGGAGGTVNLAGDSYTKLTVTGTGSPSTVLAGFNGTKSGQSDQIVLSDIKHSDILSVSYPDDDHVTLHLRSGGTFTMSIPGVKKQGYTLSDGPNGSTLYEVCFLPGTMIETPNGPRAVEKLSTGDEILVSVDGKRFPEKIVFIGKGHVVCDDVRLIDEAGYPVRVKAGALDLNVPAKDLLITPEHCLFIDGVFIPVRMLVNGVSILYDRTFEQYDYYHVETERHSVIIANGALTESYLDTGNRERFILENIAERNNALPRKTWARDAAAPLATSSEFIEEVWHRLRGHAGIRIQTRHDLSSEAGIHLITRDGRRLWPSRRDEARYIFDVPPQYREVYIASATMRPSDIIGPFVDDRRVLGVLVGAIEIYDYDTYRMHDDHLRMPDLPGWGALDQPSFRWTVGSGLLTLGISQSRIDRIVAVEIASSVDYEMTETSLAYTQHCLSSLRA